MDLCAFPDVVLYTVCSFLDYKSLTTLRHASNPLNCWLRTNLFWSLLGSLSLSLEKITSFPTLENPSKTCLLTHHELSSIKLLQCFLTHLSAIGLQNDESDPTIRTLFHVKQSFPLTGNNPTRHTCIDSVEYQPNPHDPAIILTYTEHSARDTTEPIPWAFFANISITLPSSTNPSQKSAYTLLEFNHDITRSITPITGLHPTPIADFMEISRSPHFKTHAKLFSSKPPTHQFFMQNDVIPLITRLFPHNRVQHKMQRIFDYNQEFKGPTEKKDWEEYVNLRPLDERLETLLKNLDRRVQHISEADLQLWKRDIGRMVRARQGQIGLRRVDGVFGLVHTEKQVVLDVRKWVEEHITIWDVKLGGAGDTFRTDLDPWLNEMVVRFDIKNGSHSAHMRFASLINHRDIDRNDDGNSSWDSWDRRSRKSSPASPPKRHINVSLDGKLLGSPTVNILNKGTHYQPTLESDGCTAKPCMPASEFLAHLGLSACWSEEQFLNMMIAIAFSAAVSFERSWMGVAVVDLLDYPRRKGERWFRAVVEEVGGKLVENHSVGEQDCVRGKMVEDHSGEEEGCGSDSDSEEEISSCQIAFTDIGGNGSDDDL